MIRWGKQKSGRMVVSLSVAVEKVSLKLRKYGVLCRQLVGL